MEILRKLLNKKTSDEIVNEIHTRIDEAQSKLLTEAQLIINDKPNEKLKDKAEKLKYLGFDSHVAVIDETERLKIEEEFRVQAEKIQYYMKEYPFLKFITEEELDNICEDYNLIMGPVANYIKDIPMKNINEIGKAQKLNRDDISPDIPMIRLKETGSRSGNASKKYVKMAKNSVVNTHSKSDINRVMIKYYGADGDVTRWSGLYTERYDINKQGLFIAAPLKHFNTKGLKKQGKGFFDFEVIPTDPIVFRYVKGGIQILSKWGLEADDYRIQHGILN